MRRKNITRTPVVSPQPPAPSPHHLTPELIRKALPLKARRRFTEEMAQDLYKVFTDPDERDDFFRDCITYASVVQDGKFRIEDYFSAVKYVGHKMQGDTNKDAYMKTFPHRYQKFVNKGFSDDKISSHIAGYNKTLLVTRIYEQSIIPLYVGNQSIAMEALATLAETMRTTKSDRSRIDAADKILLHLKMPEVARVQLDVNVTEDDSIQHLRDATMQLVEEQRRAIQAGAISAEEIAHSKLTVIEGECSVEQ